MEKKDAIKITARLHSELTSPLTIKGEEYLIQTESGGAKNSEIITRIYQKGRIVTVKKTDYKDILDSPDPQSRMQEMMERQHQTVINIFKTEKAKEGKTTSSYLQDVKMLLRGKNQKSAIGLLEEALRQYPDDPFLLSYYGCLLAIVNKGFKEGIGACNRAIASFKGRLPFGEEFFYPVLYLNLGRAYLAAGRRKNAIEAFKRGLQMDKDNSELLKELVKLGIRKKPTVPFLERSNPINRYIGRLLYGLKK